MMGPRRQMHYCRLQKGWNMDLRRFRLVFILSSVLGLGRVIFQLPGFYCIPVMAFGTSSHHIWVLGPSGVVIQKRRQKAGRLLTFFPLQSSPSTSKVPPTSSKGCTALLFEVFQPNSPRIWFFGLMDVQG